MKLWNQLQLSSSFFTSAPRADSIPQWVGLIQLSFRMFSVCHFTAKLNEVASRTTQIINGVPVSNNSAEIKQFHDFLTTTKVALTGMGFFSLTKGLMLKLIGTIVTYELVLVQFYDNDIKAGNLTNCPF